MDPATLDPVESGESGELLVSSPYTVKGYWNKPEETDRTCVEIDGKVYCRMGDFVREDEAEYDRLAQLQMRTESGLSGSVVQDVVTELAPASVLPATWMFAMASSKYSVCPAPGVASLPLRTATAPKTSSPAAELTASDAVVDWPSVEKKVPSGVV